MGLDLQSIPFCTVMSVGKIGAVRPYFTSDVNKIMSVFSIRGQSEKIPNFFFNLLLYLQLNQICLLQSTPLYC